MAADPKRVAAGLPDGARVLLKMSRRGRVCADLGWGASVNALKRRGLIEDVDPTWGDYEWGIPLTALGRAVRREVVCREPTP